MIPSLRRDHPLYPDIVGGITTFFTMSYIVIVNPSILASSGTGMPFSGGLTATVLIAFSMTLFLGFLDHERHGLRYASAGHDPPLLYRSGARNIVELAATGLPLGMIPGWRYDEGEEQYLELGDTILLTTDGVWEARSPSGDRFGKVRLRASLASNAACSARDVIAGILKDLEAHMRGRPHEDDMTLAVIRRVG